MDRETRRRANLRQPDQLASSRAPVRIQEQRRFFSSRGNDEGVRKARAISQALGVGIQAFEGHVERENAEGRAQFTEEILSGQTERDFDQKTADYHKAWDALDARSDLNEARRDLPEYLQEIDWENLSEAALSKAMDEFFIPRFNGTEKGMGAAYNEVVAPGLLKLQDTILSAHSDMQFEKLHAQNREKVFSTAQQLLADAGGDPTVVPEGEKQSFYNYLADSTNQFFDGSEKMSAYWESLYQIAIEAGDPELIANAPKRFKNNDPTGVDDPNRRPAHQSAMAKADAVRRSKQQDSLDDALAADQSRRAMMHSQHKIRAAQGDETVLEDIIQNSVSVDGLPAVYSRSQMTSLFDQYFKATEKKAVDYSMAQRFKDGNLIGATAKEMDEAVAQFTSNPVVLESLPEDPEERAKALRSQVLALSVTNGQLPKSIIDQLSVNTNNPEKFKQAGEIQRELEAQRPGFTQTQLTDAQARRLATYNRLLDDTGDPSKAIAALDAFDPTRHKAVPGKEWATAIDDVVDAVADKPFSLFNYDQTLGIRRRVTAEVEHYVDRGYDLEAAKEYAETAIRDRTVFVGGHMYSTDAGWGLEAEEVHEWAKEEYASRHNTKSKKVEFVPHPFNPKMVLLRNKDDVLPGSREIDVPISELVSGYRTSQLQAFEQAIDDNAVDKRKLAEERAFERAYPISVFLEPGERASMRKMAEKRWKALSIKERNALIDQEYTN